MKVRISSLSACIVVVAIALAAAMPVNAGAMTIDRSISLLMEATDSIDRSIDATPNLATVYVFTGGKPDSMALRILRELHADVAYRAFYVYGWNLTQVKAIWSGYRKFVESCHLNGIKVGAIISASILEPEYFTSTFIQDVATRHASGDVLHLYQENVHNYYYHGCMNNEIWRQHLLKIAMFAVDFGIDLIEFDEATSHWWWPGECYCDECVSQFKQYLNSKYTKSELLTKFDIPDIEEFDYRKRLAAYNLIQSDEWSRISTHPLGHEYFVFELVSLSTHFDELVSSVKDYAKSKGRAVEICANQFELKNIDIPITKSVDLISIGTGLNAYARLLSGEVLNRFGPFHYTAAPFILLGKALSASKQSVMFIDTDYAGVTEKMVKILIADALAFGGLYNLPYYSGTVGAYAGTGPVQGFKKYASFMAHHEDLFHNLVTSNPVGLLLPYETLLWTSPPGYAPWIYAACQLLSDAHILYDIVLVGDGTVMPNSLQLSDLKKYEVIFLPHVNCISDATIDLIKQYVNDGGKIFLVGDGNAVFDQMGFERLGRLDSILQHQNVSYVSWLNWAVLWDYMETKDDTIRELIAGQINMLTSAALETNASSRVEMNVFYQPHYDRLIVHLVNLDYDPVSDTLNGYRQINVKLKVPEWFAKASERALCYEPDLSLAPIKLEMHASTHYIEFTIPKIDTHCIVTISVDRPQGAFHSIDRRKWSALLQPL